jgi:hypothetical protein
MLRLWYGFGLGLGHGFGFGRDGDQAFWLADLHHFTSWLQR